MSYSSNDRSTHDGEPVEFFKFITPLETFRYTDDVEPQMCNGEIYLPLNIERGAIETNMIIDTVQTVDFMVPVSSGLAKLVSFRKTPEQLRVEVRRAHRSDDMNTDFRVEYIGAAKGSKVENEVATIETASILQTDLNGNILTVTYQRLCNHILFDERCKVVKGDWTLTATVTKVQNQLITVNNDGAGDGELNGGEVINVRTGEARGLTINAANVLTIGYPFIDIVVGDEVQLVFGCNHLRLGHCKNRFNNVTNYGGFDFIPTTNPFVDLNQANQATVTETLSSKYMGTILRPPSTK